MLTNAQQKLKETALENIKTAGKEIDDLYKQYYNSKKNLPTKQGIVMVDSIPVHNTTEYRDSVLSGLMHQIGYWEGLRQTSKMVLEFIEMRDGELKEYELDQLRIEKENEIMMENLKKSLDDYVEKNDENL